MGIQKIKSVLPPIEEINFPVCLAPMVGLSHFAFRSVVRGYLPKGAETIWPTEMISSRRLPSENHEQRRTQLGPESEAFLVPQLLANEERWIRPSLRVLHEHGVRGVDINMGCPVRKALKHNYGVSLMGDPSYASRVVATTVSNATCPVSVKIRVGETRDSSYLKSFAQGLVAAGASWICLHPRTAAQKRRGNADWTQIELLKADLNCPIIGNGDVQTASDAIAMLNETGCDMVMVGRALTARPWLLWQVGELLGWPPPEQHDGQSAPNSAEQEGLEYGRMLQKFAIEVFRLYPEPMALKKFLFFVKVGSVWLEFGQSLFARVSRAKSREQLTDILQSFFSGPHRMIQRTQLRY